MISLLFVWTIGFQAATAAPLGCYMADRIWMDTPQRKWGSDPRAIWSVIPANEDVFRKTLLFIQARPAEGQAICFEGTYGAHSALHAWSARVRPKSELHLVPRNTGGNIWIDPADDIGVWTFSYSDLYD